eukprot:1325425-Amorphochlora_amoeboformis.AAC.1
MEGDICMLGYNCMATLLGYNCMGSSTILGYKCMVTSTAWLLQLHGYYKFTLLQEATKVGATGYTAGLNNLSQLLEAKLLPDTAEYHPVVPGTTEYDA